MKKGKFARQGKGAKKHNLRDEYEDLDEEYFATDRQVDAHIYDTEPAADVSADEQYNGVVDGAGGWYAHEQVKSVRFHPFSRDEASFWNKHKWVCELCGSKNYFSSSNCPGCGEPPEKVIVSLQLVSKADKALFRADFVTALNRYQNALKEDPNNILAIDGWNHVELCRNGGVKLEHLHETMMPSGLYPSVETEVARIFGGLSAKAWKQQFGELLYPCENCEKMVFVDGSCLACHLPRDLVLKLEEEKKEDLLVLGKARIPPPPAAVVDAPEQQVSVNKFMVLATDDDKDASEEVVDDMKDGVQMVSGIKSIKSKKKQVENEEWAFSDKKKKKKSAAVAKESSSKPFVLEDKSSLKSLSSNPFDLLDQKSSHDLNFQPHEQQIQSILAGEEDGLLELERSKIVLLNENQPKMKQSAALDKMSGGVKTAQKHKADSEVKGSQLKGEDASPDKKKNATKKGKGKSKKTETDNDVLVHHANPFALIAEPAIPLETTAPDVTKAPAALSKRVEPVDVEFEVKLDGVNSCAPVESLSFTKAHSGEKSVSRQVMYIELLKALTVEHHVSKKGVDFLADTRTALGLEVKDHEQALEKIGMSVQSFNSCVRSEAEAALSRDCMVCSRTAASHVVMDCMHLVLCDGCSKGVKKCPMCKKKPKSIRKVY
eukprot:TRINITY_DN1727_c0_g1_i1.p1 TRINITY_DN1727_c0_g1~~TRINITY_DN1727_c0_g1_i1.p1  ORF type:complete len:674 (-),score=191.85 TRINITY_DN1727_c0_g1_i1:12-1988(-)